MTSAGQGLDSDCSVLKQWRQKLDAGQWWLVVWQECRCWRNNWSIEQHWHDLGSILAGQRQRVQDHAQWWPSAHSSVADHRWLSGWTDIQSENHKLWRLQGWRGLGEEQVSGRLHSSIWRAVQNNWRLSTGRLQRGNPKRQQDRLLVWLECWRQCGHDDWWRWECMFTCWSRDWNNRSKRRFFCARSAIHRRIWLW